MDNKRDRTEKLINYIKSYDIEINYGKNKARGNKGLFIAKNKNFRIDIAKGIESPFNVLLHEFAHYVHFKYDKTLKSLDFIFPNLDEDMLDELLEVTVALIPKESIKPIFDKSESLKSDIKHLTSMIKVNFPNFKSTSKITCIEKKLPYPLSYLIKYDKVRVGNNFYSINSLDNSKVDDVTKSYLCLRSKQRALRRLLSKISRLNKYYNAPSELFARGVEMYFTNRSMMENKAPNILKMFDAAFSSGRIPELSALQKYVSIN